MINISNAKQLMNFLASLLMIIDEYDQTKFTEFYSLENFSEIEIATQRELDSCWKNSYNLDLLFAKLKDEINTIHKAKNQSKYVIAYAVCTWIDRNLTYEDVETSSGKISLWSLFHVTGDEFGRVGSLNTNVNDTRIWINPKLPTRKTYAADDSNRLKRAYNRDAYYGINGDVSNYCYFRWDGTCVIENVIVNANMLNHPGEHSLRIAFAPLSCNKDLLQENEKTMTRGGYIHKISELDIKKEFKEHLHNRMIYDWKMACENNADIVFMPEMLGISEDFGKFDFESMEWVWKLCLERLSQNVNPPTITVWPSLWKDNQNGAAITYENGNLIGVQYKYFPFVDKERRISEGIQEYDVKKYFVIHIPEVHRISVLICSEFLSDSCSNWAGILNRSLDVSILIVPSYTRGEQDFLNDISNYIDTDTTVIWGNCCGAVRGKQKCIGAISKVGTNTIEIFGERMKCDGVCADIKSCFFLVDISLDLAISKSINETKSVEHVITRI